MIIGERINTQGSRKAKELVLANNFDGLIDLARNQVEDGAHCLDVSVATTERSD
ncbi:MAG: dihydropteroate synthase, partial [Thermoproteota archaeon]|nr:dihydropteroate synthase [Thermoproteota archaeon]